jgi:hypothetical protein
MNFWSSGETSAVLLVSGSHLLEKMAYVVANQRSQVSLLARRVARCDYEWPGVISRGFGEQWDGEMPKSSSTKKGNRRTKPFWRVVPLDENRLMRSRYTAQQREQLIAEGSGNWSERGGGSEANGDRAFDAAPC